MHLAAATDLRKRGVDHRRQIDGAIAERRNVDSQSLQPPIELGPEAALVHVGLERRRRPTP